MLHRVIGSSPKGPPHLTSPGPALVVEKLQLPKALPAAVVGADLLAARPSVADKHGSVVGELLSRFAVSLKDMDAEFAMSILKVANL